MWVLILLAIFTLVLVALALSNMFRGGDRQDIRRPRPIPPEPPQPTRPSPPRKPPLTPEESSSSDSSASISSPTDRSPAPTPKQPLPSPYTDNSTSSELGQTLPSPFAGNRPTPDPKFPLPPPTPAEMPLPIPEPPMEPSPPAPEPEPEPPIQPSPPAPEPEPEPPIQPSPPAPEPEPDRVPVAPSFPQSDFSDLASDMGVDYRKLRDLLAAQNYKEADGETRHLMVSIIRAMERDYDSNQTFEQFPCTDLRTIDRLWVQYSEGRFGFSVQKPIYDEVGQSYEALGDRVGWRQNGQWLNYHELTFNHRAPKGHLPRVLWVKVFGYCGWEPSSLARRLANCNF